MRFVKTVKGLWSRLREQLASDSLDAQLAAVQSAWADQFGAAYDAGYICDVYPDRVIVREPDGDFKAYPYTDDGQGNLTWGAPVDVEVLYSEISEALELTASAGKTGNAWDVRVLKFGRSLNGFYWSREAGEKLLPLLVGAPVGCFMDPKGAMGHASETSVAAGNGPLIRNVVADLQAPRLEADGVYASLHVHEDAGWLKQKLLGLAHRGVVDKVLGLSVDTLAGYVPVQLREGAAKAITEIKRLFSVDIVTRPSADGRFIRATAGPLLTQEEPVMKREQLIALITKHRPKLLEGRVVESLTDEQVVALVTEALQEPKAEPPKTAEPATVEPTPDPVAAQVARLTEMEQRLAQREHRDRVSEAVGAAAIPEIAKPKLVKDLAAAICAPEALAARIAEEVDFWAKAHASGNVTGLGRDAHFMVAPKDKIQHGLDLLFGVTREEVGKALETSPLTSQAKVRIMEGYTAQGANDPGLKFKGLRDFYIQATGDADVSGRPPARVSEASVLSSTWADALGNTLQRRLLATYAEQQYNERSITQFGSATDFRTRELVHLGYFADLASVAEDGAYVAITNPNDDKVSYAVAKRGNLFTVTLETIKNDDLRAVQEGISRLGRAARRTLAQFIWNFWMAGPTFTGGGAIFDIDAKQWFDCTSGNNAGLHCNYGTTALTFDATGAAEVFSLITKIGKFKEKDSAKALGLPALTDLWLDVPIDLFSVANSLNRSQLFATAAGNPVYQIFGVNNERINVNPLLTDATDWGIHVDPNRSGRASIVVDFLDGREEPELFMADLPTQGSLFTNDRIDYKIRHIYGGDLADVNGAAKNVVA